MKYLRMDLIYLVMNEMDCGEKVARSLVNKMLSGIGQALVDGRRVVFTDFGAMHTVVKRAHAHTHPYGHVLHIPAKRVVKFKAGKALHNALQENLEEPP